MHGLYENFCQKRFNGKATTLLQSLIGFLLLYIYSININSLQALIGSPSIRISPEVFAKYSIYNFAQTQWHTNLLFGFAVLLAILMFFRKGANLVVFLNCIFFTSFINAAYVVSDGGDNLLKLILIYMVFLNYSKNEGNRFVNLVHNFAASAIFLQVCIVYFIAGISKVTGFYWQNGSALHYILQLKAFSNNILSLDQFIVSNEFICILIAYSTIIFQIGYPFLIFNNKIKNFLIVFGILFHIGIGVLMNLPSFSMAMIIVELFLLNDETISKLTTTSESRKFAG